jgi:diguanylate cyclase (GGDEF)-like protein
MHIYYVVTIITLFCITLLFLGLYIISLWKREGENETNHKIEIKAIKENLEEARYIIEKLETRLRERTNQAFLNPVSKLPNQLGIDSAIRSLFGRFNRGGGKERITVVAIDLDHFKPVNDKYGHKNGDKVLKVAGEILQHSIRTEDVLAHLHGDEFVLVLSNTNEEAVHVIMKRAKEKFSQYHFSFAEGDKVETNFCYGLAEVTASETHSETHFDHIYHKADMDCNRRKELEGGSRSKR